MSIVFYPLTVGIGTGRCVKATEDVQQGLTQDDFDMYYEVWERYDEKASQYIPLAVVPDFMAALEEPLRLAPPNFYKMVALDIPICEGDRVHCVDILDALAKNFLSAGGSVAADIGDTRRARGRKNYNPISSMIRRQREIYCAHVIQRAWCRYVERKRVADASAAAEAQTSAAAAAAHESDRGQRRSIGRCVLGSIPEQHPDSDASVDSVHELIS